MGFHHQHHASRQHGRAQQCRTAPHQATAELETGQHAQYRPQHGGHAIGPDLAAGGYANRLQPMHHGDLGPVDADRLFVPLLEADADIHIIAAFHHLAAGLGKARLVAVQCRDSEKAREVEAQAEQHQGQARRALQHGLSAGEKGLVQHRSGQ